ncbi:MAG TPA: ABC transporter ATP-binding protein [Methylomirabilota bacterium]|nr:ABC transporter ATP-binding protein [Methylomirabilota bacterium]
MIEVRDLSKNFGAQKILDGVSFRIENGESVVIIGRSGGGKSVLLKHLIGLLQPDSGDVLIDGENIVPMNERQLLRVRQKFGMVFQGAALFDSMTVAENVAFALRRNGTLPETEIRNRVAHALEVVDLPGIENKNPAELSGGMRKRVGLARAIVYEPQILLYDEPTTGLDPIVSDSIDELMMGVRDKLKVTSVVVTHDMRTARRVGNHVIMLHHGKIQANCSPEQIFNSTDPIVRQFIDGVADPKENLVAQPDFPTTFLRQSKE